MIGTLILLVFNPSTSENSLVMMLLVRSSNALPILRFPLLSVSYTFAVAIKTIVSADRVVYTIIFAFFSELSGLAFACFDPPADVEIIDLFFTLPISCYSILSSCRIGLCFFEHVLHVDAIHSCT